MAIPEAPISGADIRPLVQAIPKITNVLQHQAVATLTAAIVGAIGKPISIEQMMEINRDIWWTLYPDAQQGAYQEWAKTSAARLKKIHA